MITVLCMHIPRSEDPKADLVMCLAVGPISLDFAARPSIIPRHPDFATGRTTRKEYAALQ